MRFPREGKSDEVRLDFVRLEGVLLGAENFLAFFLKVSILEAQALAPFLHCDAMVIV